jgi:hypothetical protein
MIGNSNPGRGSEFFSSPQLPDWLWGTPSLLTNGYLGVKQLVCEADHSPLSSTEVKNAWSCTSTPTICLHGMVLSLKKKHRDSLPLPLDIIVFHYEYVLGFI